MTTIGRYGARPVLDRMLEVRTTKTVTTTTTPGVTHRYNPLDRDGAIPDGAWRLTYNAGSEQKISVNTPVSLWLPTLTSITVTVTDAEGDDTLRPAAFPVGTVLRMTTANHVFEFVVRTTPGYNQHTATFEIGLEEQGTLISGDMAAGLGDEAAEVSFGSTTTTTTEQVTSRKPFWTA